MSKTNEEIVEQIGSVFLECFTKKSRKWGDVKQEIMTTLEEVRREERERIFGDIEQFKSEVVTMDYCDDFKDGIYATIEHILSMPCFEGALTPTKTDKQ